MNEILKKLLESSELLSEESKIELENAFNQSIQEAISEAVSQAKEETEKKVTLELHERFAKEKESLIDAIDMQVSTAIKEGLTSMAKDIKDFRDLEKEHTLAIAKEKVQLEKTLKKDMKYIIESLNAYVEERIRDELTGMKSDLMEMKQLQFGKKIFEAFGDEFRKYHINPSEAEQELHEAKIKLDKLSKKYKNVKKDKECLLHKVKVESVLKPLTGSQRKLMESILKSVPTEKVEETYKTYINRIVKETVDTTPAVVVESKPKTTFTTGDFYEEPIVESVEFDKTALLKLAGITP